MHPLSSLPQRYHINRSLPLSLLGLLAGATAIASPAPPHEESAVFNEAIKIIEEHFIDTPERRHLIYGAIKGAAKTLDPYSTFYTPTQYRQLTEATSADHLQVGIELNFETAPPKIIAVQARSPAATAGVLVHDLLLEINDQPTAPLSPQEVRSLLLGPPKSPVQLTLLREGEDATRIFTLKRGGDPNLDLKISRHKNGVVYAQLLRFNPGVARQLHQALKELPAVTGVILDLRDNPGGLFDEAVRLCDLFIEEGVIVRAIGRNQRPLSEQRASKTTYSTTTPLALVVNRGSASAAEIVTAALRDHQRARIFGEQTYGKGAIQSLFPLGDGSGLKITIARYQSPDGLMLDAAGIRPDVLTRPEESLSKARKWLTQRIKHRAQ